MNILALDTSSNICSVAILNNNNLIKDITLANTKTHSENLMPIIQNVLEQTNTKLKDINLIACCIGPGSFTGIRIGIATAKALSLVYNIPIIGVTSLECLAYNVTNFKNTICTLIDAKNNQVYCGVFDENYLPISDFIANDINTIINTIKNFSNITFVGDGSILHKDLLLSDLNNIVFSLYNTQNAFNIGKCAFNKFNLGNLQDANTITPFYLRKSQAERMKDLNGQ